MVILINGYVLLHFFISHVNSLLFGIVIVLSASAYVAFLMYLISRAGGSLLSSSWFSRMHSDGFSYLRT